MAFLQAQVRQPKSAVDFKQTTYEFEERDVCPQDQMDMHMQIGEMVYSTFTQIDIISCKLQLSLNNVQSQLKLEKVSSVAKDEKIKYLDEMVIKASFDANSSKSMEDIINKKNANIAAIKNKLKLPASEYPQAKELGETKLQK